MEKKVVRQYGGNPVIKIMMIYIWFLTLLFLPGCKKDSGPDSTGISALKTVVTASRPSPSPAKLKIGPTAFFDAALSRNGDLSAYAKTPGDPHSAMVIDPSRISVVNDPVYGKARKVMLMDVRNGDSGGVTENPRAQVQTPMVYTEGQEIFVGFSVRFTQDIWTYFLTFSEIYGAPYNGTSPFRLGIQGSNIIAASDKDGKQTNLWQEPVEKECWYDFVYREMLSRDAKKGAVQVWLRKQGTTKFTEILPSTPLSTITAANLAGPNYHKLACYYDKTHTFTDASKKTSLKEVRLYLAEHKVGGNFEQVAPALVK